MTDKTKQAPKQENNQDDIIEKVFKDGFLVRITCGVWSAMSSKIRDGEVETNPEVIKSRKMLIGKKHVLMLTNKQFACRAAIAKYGYLFMNMDSVYFIPTAMWPIVRTLYNKQYEEFLELRKEFVTQYEANKKEWQKIDPKRYDESLYPSATEVERKFYVSLTKFTIAMPSKSSNVFTPAEYKAEKEKLRAQMSEFLNDTLCTVAANLYNIIKELSKKADAGKINARRLKTIKEFFTTFDSMNITGNKELTVLKNKLSDLVGTTTKEDWTDPNFTAKVATETKKLAGEIEKSATLKRAIDY